MQECPNCHGYYFGNPNTCNKCNYNFSLRRVVTETEMKAAEEEERINKENKRREKKELEELLQQKHIEKKQLMEQIDKIKAEQINKNAWYEYITEVVDDNRLGEVNILLVQETISKYAALGWRLVHAFTNEIGKDAATTGIGGFASGINATIDSTILIFERCIKPETK